MAGKKKTIAEKIDERVQAWLQGANSFSEGAKAQYSTEGYRGNSKEYYDSVTASVAASKKEAETIRKMLQGYGSYVGDDYVKNVTKYLDEFGAYEDKILNYAKSDNEYMSSFADENAYNTRLKEDKKRADIDAMPLADLEAKLKELSSAKELESEISRLNGYDANTLYQQAAKLGYRGKKADEFVSQFQEGVNAEIARLQEELGQYGGISDIAYTTPDGKNVTWQSLYDTKSFNEDLTNQINTAKTDPDYISTVAQANNSDNNIVAAYRSKFGDSVLAQSLRTGKSNKEVLLAREMTEDEANLYGYYLVKYGREYADSYLSSMYETLDRRMTSSTTAQWKEIAKENPGFSSVVSLGGTLASGAEYLADLAMQIATGKEQYNTSSAITSAIRGTVAEEIDWTIGNWDAGAFVYNTFMSGADSFLAGITLGPAGGLALGLSAAASATNEALDRGLDSKQAFWNGLASGVFEGLFETVSIGQFGAMKEAVVHGGKDFARNLVKSMVTNATEEFATEVANILYDNLANLDFSQYETDKRMYMALGMSEEEAHQKASKQLIAQIGEAAASGALMGIGFGTVGSSISGFNTMMSDIDTGAVIAQTDAIDPLVDLAKETASPNSKAYKIASKVTDKTSARRIGALMREVGYDLTEQNKTDITNSLVERGMDAREAKKTATALADIAGAESVDKAIEQAEKNGVIIDDTVEAVIRDVILNPESSVAIRAKKLSDYDSVIVDSVVRAKGLEGISASDAFDLKKEAEFYGIGADEFLASAQASKTDAQRFARAFKERYLQGTIGDKTVSPFVGSALSAIEQNTAYRLGEIAKKNRTAEASSKEASAPKKKVESGTGRVIIDSSVSNKAREGAKTQTQAVDKIAKALGINVRFYESVVNENGNRVLSTNQETSAPNGWFDKDTNTIHLDINAGKDGRGVIMFTLAHELTHFIAKWSKTQFNLLADFVTKRYNKKGEDISSVIRIRMATLADQKVKSYMALTTEEARYEYAREEVIADSMETMLASGNVMRDLADLRTQSEGLFNKIRGFLKKFADKIRSLYRSIDPETAEGKFIAESKDAVEELEKLFANALKVSAENYAASGNVVDRFVEKYESSTTPSDSAVMSGRGNGYDGYSMSNNARAAYEDGEKPLSKWTKANIIEAVMALDPTKVALIEKVNISLLKKHLLYNSSWHHTSMHYNRTEFYAIDEDAVEGLTEEIVRSWVSSNPVKETAKPKIYRGDIDYIVWTGTRKHPKANHETLTNVNIEERGSFYVVTDDNGNELVRKKIGSNGTKVKPYSVPGDNAVMSFRTSQSGMANDSLIPYDSELSQLIETKGDYIVDSYEKLVQIVNLAFDDPNHKATVYFGIIDAQTLKNIENSVPNIPMEINGTLFKANKDYSIATTLDSIRHIVDEKGLTIDEVIDYLDRMPDTILEYDTVFFDYYTDSYKNKLPGLLFKKSFSDGTLVSFNFVSHNKRSLSLQSLYMDSGDYQKKKAAKTLLMNNLSHTSATRVGQPSTTKIPQTPPVVKTSDENSSPSDNSMQSARSSDAMPTNRTLLADALDSVATSEEDRKKLTQYKKKAAEADELERTLAELRAKKKALEEAKAKRSDIRAVQDEITKTQNRITIIDKQLFKLQATVSMKRVLESEKNRRAKQARAKQKASDDEKRKKAVSDAVKEAEDDYQKKLDAQKKHQAEIEAKRKERASRTELRHNIIDKVKKLSDKLRNPSKDKHIPASLQKPVARFLAAISIDTFGADQMINRNLKKLEALLEKLEKATNDIDRSVLMDKIAELQKSIQWEEAIGVSIKEKAATLQAEYKALAEYKDPNKDKDKLDDSELRIREAYDPIVAEMLEIVVEVCGDTPLRYMTIEQLTTLNDAINAVNKRVSESNKSFSEGKKKTIEEYAEATARELPDTSKASVVKFVKAIKRFGWGLLKPATAMEIIGSQTFTELYENIQDGEETWMQNIAKAKAFFQKIATKHGYYSWDLQKTYDFVDTRGKTFTLTLGEMLSLYAYSRRPQAAKHLEEGGFKFDEKSDERRKKIKDRKNDKENHKLNRDILKVIENKIGETEGALEFANELQAYLSKDMAALGNEISMKMYDYLAFGEENYFPIYSSKSYIDFNPDSQGNILLKNRSFTKSVVKGANNPIIVGDFVDIWTRHVNEMITYNAFALPVEDFMRTYNFKFKTADGSQDSIKDRIVKAYGEDAAKYIEQLLRDINGGVIADHSAKFADALVTRFKKLKVMLSASVVIQQPSAMARAFAMIDPKYFRGIGVGNHKERWERVMKYAPIAMIKSMGRFDINLGQSAQDYLTAQEYSGAKEKAKAVFTDKNYRDEVLPRAPAYADEMAWITIFEACEREMAELRPDLEKGSEKFMQLVGRRFTEVIRATQVYDSVFSRSQIMRSKNVFTKMITAFMSEPTTTLNMAFRSMLEASRSGKKWYALPFNRTMAAVSTSIILNSLLVSLVYAMRDDDEDETYLESYLESFTTEVADGFNPLTYIPFVKDIWSLLQGYDVERTDMALWSDIIDKAYDFIKVFNTDTSEMSEEAYDKRLKDVWSQSASAVSEILSFATGIPITNVIRDASGAVDTTVDALTSDRENSWDTMLDAIAEGFKNTLPGSNVKPNNPAKYDPTYSDYTSYKPQDAFTQFDRGNTAKGKEIIDKLIKARIKAGDTEKEAKATLRSAFTSQYKDAFKKAYLAGNDAECIRIRKLLKESGLYPNYIQTYIEWQKEALTEKYTKKS